MESIESGSLRILGVCAFVLLVFACVLCVLNPSKEKVSFSTLEWSETPRVGEGNLSQVVEVGVLLSSHETKEYDYLLSVRASERLVKTETVSLFPGESKAIQFQIPILQNPSYPFLVAVKADKLDSNVTPSLEVSAWVENPNSK